MAANRRKNLLARIVTPGGDDPLLLRLVAPAVIRTGVAATGIALVGQGGAGGYAYSILTGSAYGGLPPGLTLNADGTITGTPTTPGNYAFVAQVQDADSSVYTASFSIRILSRLIRKHRAIRPGAVGVAYTFTFMVTGNTGAVTWSIVSGNLPAGLSLDTSTGVVSGTPTADSAGLGGISYFTIRASDAGSGEALDMPSSITVYDELYGGVIGEYLGLDLSAQYVPTVFRGVEYIAQAYANRMVPGVRFYAANLPSGIRINNLTGEIRGKTLDPPTPINALAPYFQLTITDSIGSSTTIQFHIPIQEPQGSIGPYENGVAVGTRGAIDFNFVDGANTTAEVTNAGGIVTVKFNAPGGGGGGSVESVGGATPDSSGNVPVIGTGDADVSLDSSGQLVIHVESGGTVASVGGALPDSSGAVAVTSPDGSVGISVDSSGALALTAEGGGPTGIRSTIYRALGILQPGDSATLNDAPACTLTGWRISSKDSGSISIDVRATTWPTQPGPSESLIGNSLYNIILSAETTHEETDLSNWASTTLAGGERLEFYVVSASGVGAVDITVSIS